MAQVSSEVRNVNSSIAIERRRQARVKLPVSMRVAGPQTNGHSVVSVRDVNVRGAFFYGSLEVEVGDVLHVQLTSEQAISELNVNCDAEVVRVEESAIKGLNGFAVEFRRFHVEEPTRDASQPFIGWTVGMVEQLFARRPELETYASRIQGAA